MRIFRGGIVLLFMFCLPADAADIVTANFDSDRATVFLNRGGGTFSAMNPALRTGRSPVSVTRADLNGDGIQDLIFVNGDSNGERALSLLMGKGRGDFAPRIQVPLGFVPANETAIGDFNHDGHQDILVPNGYPGGSVHLYTGDGRGNFSLSSICPVTGRANSAGAGDFNGDGHLDGVVSLWDNGGIVIVFGDGKGGLTGGLVLPSGRTPQNLRVEDFNRDGKDDLAFTYGAMPGIVVYFNTGDNQFVRQDIPAGIDKTGSGIIRLGDFNNDGYTDLVTVQRGAGHWYLTTFFYNTITKKFDHRAVNTLVEDWGENPNGMDAADFNDDGKTDVVVQKDAHSIVVYPGRGNGFFDPAHQSVLAVMPRGRPVGIVTGDFQNKSVEIKAENKLNLRMPAPLFVKIIYDGLAAEGDIILIGDKGIRLKSIIFPDGATIPVNMRIKEGDYDNSDRKFLKLQFDGPQLARLLAGHKGKFDQVEVVISGTTLAGVPFKGQDVVKIKGD